MIFSDSPQQKALERMMTAVPKFRPKGGGIMVLHRFEYTAEMCDCRYCLYYCRKCTVDPYAAYLAGKIRLTESEVKDVFRAIRDFEIAAENGNDYAEYQLGKIYLYGKEVERDDEKAIAYLSAAAEHGNPYAEQLLHSIRSNRNWSVSLGAIRLLQHLSRMIQNRLDDEKKGKAGGIDRKLKRRIDEKKQAHGLKQG